ncbi:MAG TPA: hypothetical protein VKB19_19695 [Pedobacter sp.]|nr:hypothetical protein [Pedobacter sp.]
MIRQKADSRKLSESHEQYKKEMRPYQIRMMLLFCPAWLMPVVVQTKLDSCTDVHLKGYLIKEFKKQDVLDLKSTREMGNSFLVDVYQRNYFVPIQQNLQMFISSKDSLIKFRPDQLYLFRSIHNDRLIQKHCQNYKSIEIPNVKKLELKFHGLSNDKSSLYKIYYYECKAKKIQLENNFKNTIDLVVPFVRGVKNITCYFIYDEIILQEIDNIGYQDFQRLEF